MKTFMPKEIFGKNLDEESMANYDWKHVFEYAINPECASRTGVDLGSFKFQDVQKIYGFRIGQNDGDSWKMCGKLKDGRFFYIEARCDYTGWG